MKPMKRAIHIDFHTMPGIHNFNETWDAKKFAAILKEAHVEYINAFAKCNLGFAYYPTRIGLPYPGMKGDMFGDLLEECHRVGIGVSAYLNVGLDHEQARLHREWCVQNKDGQVIYGDKTANFFRNMCYNTGYRDYITGMIKEVIDNYDVDGIFCDCMGLQVCYGNECLEDIKKNGFDPLVDEKVITHSKDVLMDISKQIKQIVGNERYLYLNGIPNWTTRELNTHTEVECLPSGWSYDFFWPQVAYMRNIQKNVLYMTGRFQINWGDFGGFKRKASLENDIWDALCNGVDVSIGDHMHPAKNLERDIYKVISEIYAEVKKLEPWTEGAVYKADIGVLTDSEGFLDDEYKGLTRMFGELKHSFNIVNEYMDLSSYKVLILPDEMAVTPTLKQKLEKHLKEGKGILSTGKGGLNINKDSFAMKQWSFDYDGEDKSNSSYFHMREKDNIGVEDMDWAMYNHGILIKKADNIEVMADYIKPYFSRHWDGFHGYFYTPPEGETEHAAVVKADNIIHICFKIFTAYYNSAMLSHKALVKYCLDKLLPEPLLKCAGIPSTARVTLTGKKDTMLLHVKTTHPEVRGRMNIIEEHQILPAGAVVSIKGNYSIAYTIPDKKPIKLEQAGEYTNIILPAVNGYYIAALEK